MAFERPPQLSGAVKDDLARIRDYLFRMAGSLDTVAGTNNQALTVRYQNGKQVLTPAGSSADIDAVRKNASELRDLIIKTANELDAEEGARADGDTYVQSYVDSKTEVYDSRYLAQSTFGTFQENITTMIETTARGVVESYDYDAAIQSTQDSIGLLQSYYTSIEGEIRRGIVLDPDTGNYVTGIAIAQALKFKAAVSQAAQAQLPDDGYTYYEMYEGQTFGLYTSVGWQFWIDGYKKGWYNSQDGMLHVANIMVEENLNIGGTWQIRSSGTELEITYVGS